MFKAFEDEHVIGLAPRLENARHAGDEEEHADGCRVFRLPCPEVIRKPQADAFGTVPAQGIEIIPHRMEGSFSRAQIDGPGFTRKNAYLAGHPCPREMPACQQQPSAIANVVQFTASAAGSHSSAVERSPHQLATRPEYSFCALPECFFLVMNFSLDRISRGVFPNHRWNA